MSPGPRPQLRPQWVLTHKRGEKNIKERDSIELKVQQSHPMSENKRPVQVLLRKLKLFDYLGIYLCVTKHPIIVVKARHLSKYVHISLQNVCLCLLVTGALTSKYCDCQPGQTCPLLQIPASLMMAWSLWGHQGTSDPPATKTGGGQWRVYFYMAT